MLLHRDRRTEIGTPKKISSVQTGLCLCRLTPLEPIFGVRVSVLHRRGERLHAYHQLYHISK